MATATIAKRVALNVSRAIVESGQTKKHVSEVTGIAYTTLGRKLAGGTEFTFTELKAIADLVGVAPSHFTPDEFVATAEAVAS